MAEVEQNEQQQPAETAASGPATAEAAGGGATGQGPVAADTAKQEAAEVRTAQFMPVEPTPEEGHRDRKMDLLLDLSLPVSIELGRTSLIIRDILDLQRGSVVEFEKLASEPVDVLVNGKKMAEGEVVVIEKHFGIRITNLVETSERVKGLGS